MAQLNPQITALKTTPLYIRRAVTASVVSAILSLIAIMFFSLLVSIQILPESFIPALTLIITIACAFFSGYLTALSVPAMGLVNGLISGASYFLIMFIISCIFAPGFSVNSATLRNIIISVLGAGIGGIVSINVRASRRNKRRRR